MWWRGGGLKAKTVGVALSTSSSLASDVSSVGSRSRVDVVPSRVDMSRGARTRTPYVLIHNLPPNVAKLA